MASKSAPPSSLFDRVRCSAPLWIERPLQPSQNHSAAERHTPKPGIVVRDEDQRLELA
jgi:hypothetical protein